MKDMGDQFMDIIGPRLQSMQPKVGPVAAEMIDARMKVNTEQGRGFSNDPYDSTYSPDHARKRRKRGLQTAKVDLRYTQRRIERTVIRNVGGNEPGTRIEFAEGGHIFKWHHDGTAKGEKTRSIWPKSPMSIPRDLRNNIKTELHKVLSGQK